MRIDTTTHTSFQAKIILAEKNNTLIKKAIKSSFNHEHLESCLDQIYKYQPRTTLLVQINQLDKPEFGATHEITITNQNNAQEIKDTWGEQGVYAWAFGQLIDKLTNLRDEFVNNFWNAPAIERKHTPSILRHEIFADEYDFDYDNYLKECDQKETMQKLSNKLDNTSSNLDEMIKDYKYDKKKSLEQESLFESESNYYPTFSHIENDNTWAEIKRIKELHEKYPQLYKDDDGNRAIWAATMGRNCNK